MDYKTNTLTKQLECKEQALPDFPTVLFGVVPNGPLVFDSTEFYISNELQELDYKVFQRINKRYINSIIKNANVKASDLFYLNHDGHILMHHELIFLFLAFAGPSVAAYFNGILGELFANGVAYSDRFVTSLAAERIPDETLQQIIKDRNNG